MQETYHILRNASLNGTDLEDLRVAVRWDRMEGLYEAILKKSYSHFSVTVADRLIAFVNVISDGIGDAFLVDLMVHPDHQHQGLATALVEGAIQELSSDGIRCIEVIFDPRLDRFYRRFGFHILSAGIIDRWEPNE